MTGSELMAVPIFRSCMTFATGASRAFSYRVAKRAARVSVLTGFLMHFASPPGNPTLTGDPCLPLRT